MRDCNAAVHKGPHNRAADGGKKTPAANVPTKPTPAFRTQLINVHTFRIIPQLPVLQLERSVSESQLEAGGCYGASSARSKVNGYAALDR
jgi:hypothetical protein